MSLNEKQPLLEHGAPTPGPSTRPTSPPPPPEDLPRGNWPRIWPFLAALVVLRLFWAPFFIGLDDGIPSRSEFISWFPSSSSASQQPQCRQADPLFPSQSSDSLEKMDAYLASPQFLNASVPRLAGAVQIHTQSYDDMGPIGTDPRWDVMYDLAAYLENTFPLVHSSLRLEKINTHGLLYTWQGSDTSLKPTVLMAHQDTVPVEQSSIGDWTYPPWSGAFDGRFLWGRGSGDCKNSLIGILETVELLLDAGFAPKRTLLLSFGFDEEISGGEGAAHLSQAILDRYGKDGVAVIVDEGSSLDKQWGTLFALPAVAEKGYIDVDVIVRMPGGHSSVPPQHNGIGVMGELITAIEAAPYEPHLHNENPVLGLLQCGAEYADEFPSKLKKELRSRNTETCPHAQKKHNKDKLALEAAKEGDYFKYQFTTSVAADLISGGAKINALPERTVLTVNHRVNVGDTSAVVKDRLTSIAAKAADKFNLTLYSFPEEKDAAETTRSITLQVAFHSVLEPAPVSPTTLGSDGETTAWGVLAGTTRALYGEELIMAPGLSTGNTDTKFYWDLTRNIYRYFPGYDEEETGLGGIHTVNEKASMLGHVKAVQWFSMFIRNMDEADL